MRDIPGEKRRLADALRAGTIAQRDRLAAFVLKEATQVASAGLPCLIAALARLPSGELLRQEILRTPCR